MLKINMNNDSNFVKEMWQRLRENDGYCPCSLTRNEDTRCMCKEFKEQSEPGYCHCGLYYKEIIDDQY